MSDIRPFEQCIEKVIYTNKVQKNCCLESGKYPVISQESELISGYWDVDSDLFISDKPVIVFGDHTRVIKYIDFNFVLGADGVKIIQPRDFIDTKYFYYYLLANPIESKGYARHYKFLKDLKVPIPSLSNQGKIVEKLDSIIAQINRAIAAAEANIKNAEALFQSYLTEIFERGGEGWVELSLQKLLDCGWITSHLDGNHGSDYPRKEEFIDSGVPYISANCLDNDNIDMRKSKFLSKDRAAILRKVIAINDDVLFAHNATVGPVAVLKTDEEKVILGTSLTYYRCDKNYIKPEYLANYMRSMKFKKQYLSIMRQSTRNQIPITKQRDFFHVIPPIDIQVQLLDKFNVILDMKLRYENVVSQKISSLHSLRNSILKKAFNGELIKE